MTARDLFEALEKLLKRGIDLDKLTVTATTTTYDELGGFMEFLPYPQDFALVLPDNEFNIS